MGLILVAHHPEHGLRRFEITEAANVGSSPSSDLMLERPVAGQHARFLYRDHRLIVVDLHTALGTYVDGRRIVQATIVREGQEVSVGDWTIRTDTLLPTPPAFRPRSPREAELLGALQANPADDALRQVYGDWLEENGHPKEAEILSLEREIRDGEDRIDSAELGRLGYRLRVVAETVPFGWRAIVTRPRVEHCHRPEVCPRTWDRLTPGPSMLLRHCGACQEPVHLTDSMSVARRRVSQNERVAVDLALQRYPRDLEVALARVPEEPVPIEQGVTALPFFAHDEPPRAMGALLQSLNIVPPEHLGQGNDMGFYTLPQRDEDDNRQPSAVIRHLSARYHWDMYHDSPKSRFSQIDGTGCDRFSICFTADGDLVEDWLRTRFGAGRLAIQPVLYEGGSPAPHRIYGGHWLYRESTDGGCILSWEDQLPDWALAPTDKNAALRYLNELTKVLRRPECTHDAIKEYGSRPPARSGLVVTGPLNRNDFWLKLEPALGALELAHALEVDGPIGESSDTHMSTWIIRERNPKSRLGYPRYGHWVIEAYLDGWPSGADLEDHYAAKELGDKDRVVSLVIKPFEP